MRFITSFLVFVSLSFATQTFAQNVDIQSFMQHGLSEVQISLKDSFQQQLIHDTSCPADGSLVIDNVFEKKGKLMTALGTMQAILNEMAPIVTSRQSDISRCGSCKQTNVISSLAMVSPEKVVSAPECENRPTETFARDFDNTKDIQEFTQDLLKGKGDDGKRLEKNCPNPCAYYITTAQTVLPAGRTHLTLTIQCGQPRKDSIFAAAYIFKSGLVHQWACSK